jgi:hypothetical protein
MCRNIDAIQHCNEGTNKETASPNPILGVSDESTRTNEDGTDSPRGLE